LEPAVHDLPTRHAMAKRTIAAPDNRPSAATETATASACDAPEPDAIRAAAPAPTCAAVPAGPIGSAAAAAPAQRKRSASGNEKPTPSVPRRTKHANARTSQQADTSAHASDARRNDVVRGLNQRPSRKRRARSLADRRGRATITAAAATPPAATTASPMRAPLPAPERATPTEASGARASLSINPSMTLGMASARTLSG